MRVPLLVFAMAVLVTPRAMAQQPTACRILCAPEFNVEPTVTFGKVFGLGRIVGEDGTERNPASRTPFTPSWGRGRAPLPKPPMIVAIYSGPVIAPVRPARLAMTEVRSCGSTGLGTWT